MDKRKGLGGLMAMVGEHREAGWGKVTAEEKLERMRSVIKSLERQMRVMNSKMAQLLHHAHDQAGNVVVKVEGWYEIGEQARTAAEEGEVWF